MPCFSRMRWNCLATSPSMPGRMRSRYSTTVTSAPSRRHTEPSSRPITPAPTTISFAGTLSSASAPVEETIVFSSMAIDAGQRRDVRAGGDDDVLGLQRRDLAVLGLTSTLPARRDRAGAGEDVDLVLLEQEGDAVDVGVDRSSLCFIIAGRSSFGLPTSMPSGANHVRRDRTFRRRAAAPWRECSRC